MRAVSPRPGRKGAFSPLPLMNVLFLLTVKAGIILAVTSVKAILNKPRQQ